MNKTSNKECIISSPAGDLSLSLFEFERFNDDSSVHFKVNCQSTYFSIKRFDFYADFNSFIDFLPKLESLYNSLEGNVKLIMAYESPYISIDFQKNGHVCVECFAVVYGTADGEAKVGFVLDQTFIPSFIDALKNVYRELQLR